MAVRLLSIGSMPRIAGFDVPESLYTVIASPAPLAGMTYPNERTAWQALSDAGFRWLACLTTDRPEYDPAPLALLVAVELEDLFDGRHPAHPEAERAKIDSVVEKVVSRIRQGEGTVIHCVGGTGRTGTILGGVLRRLGVPGSEVQDYLIAVHAQRNRTWPESAWQGEYVAQVGPCAD
jgi:protein-tyrosine phosphatase